MSIVILIVIIAIEYHFKPRIDILKDTDEVILWYNELGRTSKKRTYKKWKY